MYAHPPRALSSRDRRRPTDDQLREKQLDRLREVGLLPPETGTSAARRKKRNVEFKNDIKEIPRDGAVPIEQ
ncbi:MAG: hypothetical protein FE78DRAFT_34580 [Acidomyces sp. 'richmondensis']|nr:MAG: hypothetical protein FE78DRAFT_34580 [Acidomyces sp. 'richmondensis']